jgi:cyclopropane-fatty-acyl-phospholipid synthase
VTLVPATPTEQRVITCYSAFDKFFPTTGLLDYTEGIYHNDPATPYEQAKQNQFDYLLDQIQCGPGARVLEVGCGNGTLLHQIKKRGAVAVGITITPDQVRVCHEQGLDVRLMDFFDIDPALYGTFDAIVANGPIEHFVQPEQASRGQADAIYARMFAIFHRLIDPQSAIRRVVNTTVHFDRPPSAADLLRPLFKWRLGSDNFHYTLLARSFGGFYPVDGQLERCASPHFSLERAVDGTRDYFYTSEEWLRRIQRALRTATGLRIAARFLPLLLRQPVQLATMVTCMLITQSWNWQFRSATPPAKLWRQTWAWTPQT